MNISTKTVITHTVSLDDTELNNLITELNDGFNIDGYLDKEDDKTLYELLEVLKSLAYKPGGSIHSTQHTGQHTNRWHTGGIIR